MIKMARANHVPEKDISSIFEQFVVSLTAQFNRLDGRMVRKTACCRAVDSR